MSEPWNGTVCTICRCRWKGSHPISDCRANVVFERDDALSHVKRLQEELKKVQGEATESMAREFVRLRHAEKRLKEELHEARTAARRYFKWINDDEFPDCEHTERELAQCPWLDDQT